MASSSVTVGSKDHRIGTIITVASLSGTTPVPGTQLSTADSLVGQVMVRSVEPIKVFDSNGTVISSERAEFTFPFAPTDIRIDGLTDNYTELARPGLRPLVRRDTKNAMKVAFTARIVNRAGVGTASCEELIDLLSAIASLNVDLHLVGLGVLASSKKFRITDMALETKRMNPQQRITIADVNLTFTEVVTVGLPVPGMSFLKDATPSISNLLSGSKSSNKNTPEVDKWTLAKGPILGNT